MSRSAPNRTRFALDPVSTTLLALVLLAALLVGLPLDPFDDALFFKRFAHNWLAGEGFSWNAADGPVFGNTSQSFQAVVGVVTWLWPDHTIVVTKALAAAFLLASALTLRSRQRHELPLVLLLAAPAVLATVPSGMETAWCVWVMALFVRFAEPTASGKQRPWWLGPLMLVVCYATRPDTLLLTSAFLALSRRHLGRKTLLRDAAASVVGVLALSAVFTWYYGFPIPNAFFVKSVGLTPYGEEFLSKSPELNLQFAIYACFPWLPWLVSAGWLRRGRALRWIVPTVLFVGYHGFLTVPVMGSFGRFYVPATPFVAAMAAELWASSSWDERRKLARYVGAGSLLAPVALWACGVPIWEHSLFAVATAALLFGAASGGTRTMDAGSAPVRADASNAPVPLVWRRLLGTAALVIGGTALAASAVPPRTLTLLERAGGWAAFGNLSDDAIVEFARRRQWKFAGVQEVARCLPPDVHVYHSELGVTGHVLENARITDLVGLMSTRTRRGLDDFDAMCTADTPAAIFYPHAYYARLRRQIAASGCMRSYVLTVKSSCPLFVRKDLAPAFRRCVSLLRAERPSSG